MARELCFHRPLYFFHLLTFRGGLSFPMCNMQHLWQKETGAIERERDGERERKLERWRWKVETAISSVYLAKCFVAVVV